MSIPMQHSMIDPSTGINQIAGIVLSTYIMKKFQLDYYAFGILNIGLINVLNEFSWFWDTNKNSIVIALIIISACYYIYKNSLYGFTNFASFFKKNNSKSIVLCDDGDINTFFRYVEKNMDFFETPSDISYGDPYEIMENVYGKQKFNSYSVYRKRACYDVKVKFNDKRFNCIGHYIWRKKSVSIDTEIKKNNTDEFVKMEKPYSFLEIVIESCKERNYFESINAHLYDLNSNGITLFHYKILCDEKDTINDWYIMYDGLKQTSKDLEKLFIDSFFHDRKDEIWKMIKTIHFNPEKISELGSYPRCSYLLYGPPGTGKSSFAYRVARALNRHVISLDLRQLKKANIYQIIKRPTINGKNYQPKDIVYIFDEFDLTVKELYNRSLLRNISFEQSLKNVDKKITEIGNTNMNNAGPDDLKIGDVYKMLLYKESEQDMILEDLLEILQGPVPLEGSIFFATTNKYDDIKQMCPALVRHGRLTPILFPNITTNILNEISMYYFNKKPNIIIPENCLIPPVQIIDIALQHCVDETNKFVKSDDTTTSRSYTAFINQVQKCL